MIRFNKIEQLFGIALDDNFSFFEENLYGDAEACTSAFFVRS